MEQVQQRLYQERGSTRFIYENGLKSLFAACHDPLPSKMTMLLRRLEELDAPQHMTSPITQEAS